MNQKIGKIYPNELLWKKPIEYFKEYCSYVTAFNKAVAKRDKQDKKEK